MHKTDKIIKIQLKKQIIGVKTNKNRVELANHKH